jgi:REP element-mobilizing transposase RayT
MGRGIEGTKIFRKDTDREDFLSRLGNLCQEGFLAAYAWSLMESHLHLLVRTGNQPLSKSMRKLLTGYVINFNRRHKRYGHLFQNRYKSIVCEDDPYLLELTRYIHLNPVRAGVVQDMRGLSRYPWTGHSVLMGQVKRGWQDTDTILAYFGKRKKVARIKYEEFVREGMAQGRRPELVGGGLIRSLGGWAEVLSVRRKGNKASSDQRILGSSEFVEDLLSEVDEREKETLRFSVRVRDLGLVAEEIKKGEGLGELELRSGRRQRKVSRGRRLFCQLAVGKMGYPGAEVARFLGVTTSAVIRAAYSEELPELQKYL